jgi:hypothetical protein
VRLVLEKKSGKLYACKSISKAKLISKEDVQDVRREVRAGVGWWWVLVLMWWWVLRQCWWWYCKGCAARGGCWCWCCEGCAARGGCWWVWAE